MRTMLVLLAAIVMLSYPCILFAEEQVRDQSGRVVEIRQQYGNTTYAYDANRNLLYTATRIPGGGGAVDFRDRYGVHVGVWGEGILPWATRRQWQSR